MYYPILLDRTIYLCFFPQQCIIMQENLIMTEQSNCCKSKSNCSPTKVESELSCKATAELNESVVDDLQKADASLKDLLKEEPHESEHQDIEKPNT